MPIKPTIKPGQYFYSRTKKEFRVVSVDKKGGFICERTDTGSTFKISSRKLATTQQRIDNGETFALQASPSKGGIDFTVGVVCGVVFALGLKLSSDGKRWVK